MYCIYLARNPVNGKGYVGQTGQSLEERRIGHEKAAKNGSSCVFHKALRKYGSDVFEWKVISECSTEEELNNEECTWIKLLKTKVPNGYNLTDGGEGMRGFHLSQEAKDKISEANKGNTFWKGKHHSEGTKRKIGEASRRRKPDSDETRRKKGLASMGRVGAMTGKKHSKETKEKIKASTKIALQSPIIRSKQSLANLGKPKTKEHKAKIAAALTGKKHSPERIAAMISGKAKARNKTK